MAACTKLRQQLWLRKQRMRFHLVHRGDDLRLLRHVDQLGRREV